MKGNAYCFVIFSAKRDFYVNFPAFYGLTEFPHAGIATKKVFRLRAFIIIFRSKIMNNQLPLCWRYFQISEGLKIFGPLIDKDDSKYIHLSFKPF